MRIFMHKRNQAGNWKGLFLCLLELQLHKQISAKSFPVHWLCLGSNTEQLLHPPLEPTWCLCPWTSTTVCEQFHWAHSCPYLMSWTAPRPCSPYLLDLGGRYSVLLYFFPDPKMMLRVQPISIFWREFPWCERLQNHLGLVFSSLLARGDGSGQETKRS